MSRARILACPLIMLAALAGARAEEPADDAAAAFARAEQSASQGKYKAAFTDYNKALQLFGKARDLAGTGRTLNRIARIHCDLGSFDKARQIFAKARGFLEKAGDPGAMGELHKNLGVLEELSGNPRLAEEHADKALELYREAGDTVGQGHCLTNLGGLRESLGRYKEALALQEQARRLYAEAGNRRFEAITLNNMGTVHLSTGNYLKALEFTRQALDIARELKLRPVAAQMLHTLGSIYRRLGDADKALAHYTEALTLHTEDGRLRQVALTQIALGQAQRDRGDLDRAVVEYEAARKTLEQIGARGALGSLETSLGVIATQRQDFKKAQDHFRAALEAARKLQRPEDEAKNLNFLGLVALNRRATRQAIPWLRRAVAVADKAHLPERAIVARELLAFAYMASGRIDRGIKTSKQAIAEAERMRGQIEGDELKSGLFSRFVGGYHRLSELYLRKYRKSRKRSHLERSFQVLEKGRAQSLLEMLSKTGAEIHTGAPQELVEQEAQLQRQRRTLLKKRKAATAHAERKAASREIAAVEIRLRQLADEIKTKSPGYGRLKYPTSASLAQVQKSLAADEILLEYSLGAEFDKSARLWVIDRRRVTHHSLDRKAVVDAIPIYRETLRDPLVRGLTRARRKLLEKKLYKELIEPAEWRMKRKRRVIVAPQGALYALPFEALRRPDGSYLADHFTFLYTPSATLLVELSRADRRPAERRPYLAFADPPFAPEDDPTRLPEGALRLDRLPGTASEVRAAAEAFGTTGDDVLYLRERAQESTLKKLDLTTVRFVHFATHGLLGEEVDWLGQPALALDLQGDKTDDGLLTMEEVFNLELGADAVLLSACNTGRGRQVRGEGVMGLTRAFFYAGSPVVVVSLWPVSDESTAALISELARRLASGERVADAMAEARRALRAMRKTDRWGQAYEPYNHPFYWAPFVVLGRD